METAGPIAAIEQEKPQRPGCWPKGVSGNPTGRQVVGERAAELFAAMAADFGELSAVDTALLHQACLLLARAERVKGIKHADAGVRMSSEARRLIEMLRRHVAPPKQAVPSFAEVAAAAQLEADERRAAELAEDDAAEPAGEAQAETAISLPGESEHESPAFCESTNQVLDGDEEAA